MRYILGLDGIENKLLFVFENAVKFDVDEENNSITIYDKNKKVVFIANKNNVDFVTRLEDDMEIPSTLVETYARGTEKVEEVADEEPSTETTTNTTTTTTDEEPKTEGSTEPQ